jgi:hypothetical protein
VVVETPGGRPVAGRLGSCRNAVADSVKAFHFEGTDVAAATRVRDDRRVRDGASRIV